MAIGVVMVEEVDSGVAAGSEVVASEGGAGGKLISICLLVLARRPLERIPSDILICNIINNPEFH